MSKVTTSLEQLAELAGGVSGMMESVVEAVENQTTASLILDAGKRIGVAAGIACIVVTIIPTGRALVTGSVVQTNSATSEECAAASEELSSQANIMHQMMSEFKVSSKVGGSFGSPSFAAPAPSYQSSSVQSSFSSKRSVTRRATLATWTISSIWPSSIARFSGVYCGRVSAGPLPYVYSEGTQWPAAGSDSGGHVPSTAISEVPAPISASTRFSSRRSAGMAAFSAAIGSSVRLATSSPEASYSRACG